MTAVPRGLLSAPVLPAGTPGSASGPDREHRPGPGGRRGSSGIGPLVAVASALLLLGGCVAAQARHALRAGSPGSAVPATAARTAPPTHAAPPTGATPPGAAASEAINYPEQGSGAWTAATGGGGPAGTSGPLLRYAVVVERDITGVDPQRFAAEVSATLADPRGWTGGGEWRLQWVGGDQPRDFTIHLATPGTRDVLCESGFDRYTSCRQDDRVVLNVARWAHGVPGYGVGLDGYRRYLVGHEVGHALGQGHELCTGPGQPAPVMQQQTLGLHGCTANPWVYLGGHRYAGPPGEYDDPVPGVPPAG